MAVELGIKLVPTDEGIMMLAEANEEYVDMIVCLRTEYDGEYSYVVPTQEDEHLYLTNTTSTDQSVFSNPRLLSRNVMNKVYRQPYSESELEKWCLKAEMRLSEMISTYKSVLERMNTDRGESL